MTVLLLVTTAATIAVKSVNGKPLKDLIANLTYSRKFLHGAKFRSFD